MTALGILVLALLAYLAFHYGTRFLTSWFANRAVAKALSPDTPRTRLDPESRFVIHLSETEVSCNRPDGTIESVRWGDIQKVEVLTNSDGPLLPDVFWLLHGTEKGCCIPQGATGDSELLDRLQKLPGFNNQAFIESMGSTQEALFLCWQKPAS
ncbi:hypothetical protein [Prosthecobacter sp.]|uniref:hypothetical protein n=1 Tax=Prosthecobacter sp. TaxID=1965333 RepID=UPI0024890284|nr:hypothetical protein [Prosthecobacter sp.]MDI1314404.1 hypothetical protein [Prosthecobacter sp.]